MMNRVWFLILATITVSCAQKGIGFYKTLNGEPPVFYQILIDRFRDGDSTNNYLTDRTNPYGYHGGDLKGILESIDYLYDLGINVILVSPVVDNISTYVDYNGFKHYGYHGYWPEELDRIEENFGDIRILTRLVNQFHQKRIAFVQDVVLNHAGYRSKWIENPLWVRSFKYGGCEQGNDLRMCLFGLPDFKTEREDVKRFLILKYRQLQEKVGFDGFRIDAIKHIDDLLSISLISELRKDNPDLIFIGEYWGSSPTPDNMSLFGKYNVDFLYDFNFRDYVSAFLRKRIRDEAFIKYLNERYDHAERGFLVFLNNHDMDGLITHFEEVDDTIRGRLYKIMAVMQFFCGGAPIVYYGEENGIYIGKGIENRRDMDFTERVKGLRSFYKGLIKLRRSGLLNGKFHSKMVDGLLFLEVQRANSVIAAIINREIQELSVKIMNTEIRVQPLGVEMIEISESRVEYITPH